MTDFDEAVIAVRAAKIGGCCGTGPGHIKAIRETLMQELFQ